MKFSNLEFSFEIYGYFHNIYLIYKLLFITNCYSKFTKICIIFILILYKKHKNDLLFKFMQKFA